MVQAAGPTWCALVEAERPLRNVQVAAGEHGIEVRAEPVGDRVPAAWSATCALVDLLAADPPAFHGVPATLYLPGLTITVPADVLAGVADGKGRRWWARRVEMRVG